MAAEDNNWKTRLFVKFDPKDGSTPALISPITNFNPHFSFPRDIVDSIDGDNLGTSQGNRRFTFDFELLAFNKAVFRDILGIAMQGARFAILVGYQNTTNDDWFVDAMVFDNCEITEADPSNISNDGKVPTGKYSAVCLDVNISDSGKTIANTHVNGATGALK